MLFIVFVLFLSRTLSPFSFSHHFHLCLLYRPVLLTLRFLFPILSPSVFLFFILLLSFFFLSDVIELYCYACCLYHSHEYLHYHNIAILFITIIIVNTVIITFIVTFIIAVISFLGVSICLVFFLSFFPNFASLHHSLSLHILRIFFYSIFCLTFSVHP